ncbi:MAG: RusA family crossover junction endodeoxyribonuclease [bacterium]
MQIIINIEPCPYVRMTQRGKYVKWNAQKYLGWKVHFGYLLRQYLIQTKYQGEFYSNLLKMSGEIYLPIGKYNRVDLSNLVKAIEDACQGILYKNDKQIKSYGSWDMIPISKDEMPKIILEVESIPDWMNGRIKLLEKKIVIKPSIK